MADRAIDMLKRVVGFPETTAGGTRGLPDEDTLSKMSWQDLMTLRKKPGLTRADQNLIGPYDHRAYTRENVLTPYDAVQNLVLTAGYTPLKAVGAMETRSDPSLAEMGQAIMGIAEGVKKNIIGAD